MADQVLNHETGTLPEQRREEYLLDEKMRIANRRGILTRKEQDPIELQSLSHPESVSQVRFGPVGGSTEQSIYDEKKAMGYRRDHPSNSRPGAQHIADNPGGLPKASVLQQKQRIANRMDDTHRRSEQRQDGATMKGEQGDPVPLEENSRIEEQNKQNDQQDDELEECEMAKAPYEQVVVNLAVDHGAADLDQRVSIEQTNRQVSNNTDQLVENQNVASASSRKLSLRKTLLLVFLVCVAVAVVVAIVLIGNSSSAEPNNDDQDGIVLPDDDQAENNISPAPPTREQQILDLLFPLSGTALTDPSSQRYEAYNWLVHDDPLQLTASSNSSNSIGDLVLIERYVVALFYLVTGGPTNWTDNLGFLSGESTCDWFDSSIWKGVRCHSNGTVRGIQVDTNNLYGTLPHELSALQNLQEFLVHENSLYGSIPSALNNCTHLFNIALPNNDFTGPIPDLSNLADLLYLHLFNNFISGTIPEYLKMAKNLIKLHVGDNLLSGTLPAFDSLDQFLYLVVDNNLLTGTIPPSLGSLVSLDALMIDTNGLSGSVPSSLGRLSNVTLLWLHDNRLTGSIPSDFGQLYSLLTLRMNGNELTGTIPSELGWNVKVDVLDLGRNELTGPIPSEIGLLTDLEILYLHENKLTGTVPSQLANLGALQYLLLHNNSVTDGISHLCDNLSFADSIMLFSADCLPDGGDSQEAQIQCPCCTHCCANAFDLCHTYDYMVCEEKATALNHNSTGTACTCSEEGDTISCKDDTNKCLHCNADESLCYIDSGIVFGIEPAFYSIAIDHVRGRDESVVFQSNGISCAGFINGDVCDSCDKVKCSETGGQQTAFQLNCSSIGYGLFSECKDDGSPDDPFDPIWDSVRQLETFELVLPNRSSYECVEYNVSQGQESN